MRHMVAALGALCLAVWCWVGWVLLIQTQPDPHASYSHGQADRAALLTGLLSHLLDSLP